MPISEQYRHYFNIDPEYFPAVNQAVINQNPDMWKKFYPHETFVKLIKTTVDVLERKQKLSIWVEGAYGTGKSHAVLTLKKLLDAGEEDTSAYFTRYGLDKDLYNRFQGVKNSGKILTVHRYGSATIRGTHNLVFAVQESVEHALREAGIENKGGNALRQATVNWLTDPDNRSYFNGLITGSYSELFGGDDVNAVVEKLNTYAGDALTKVMDNIFKVADERQIKALSLSTTDLSNWLREVIKANELKAIVFIWDEFTEYFYNNARNLTGFQELCEISETDPFYFVLVTHVTQGLFHDKDQDYRKLNGRFVSPHSQISLPETIAFQLMGAAMEKNQDPAVLEDWEEIQDELQDLTKDSRKLVQKISKITDKEMVGILPIHPYAALLLQHISAAFDSNQRSMFDFIKNDRGDEIKGFQWFIDNCGPEDENPLLTVDMLWDFFYEKGRESLTYEIRTILDYYHRVNGTLDSDQRRVLKTVLLMQAISQYAGTSVELFVPNEQNLNSAFEGTDMEGDAAHCADQMVKAKVLYNKSLGGGKSQYAAYNYAEDIDIGPYKEKIDRKTTTAIINEELRDKSCVANVVEPSAALKLRYEIRSVSAADFDSAIKQIRNMEARYINKIPAVVCFAKDDNESVLLGKRINSVMETGSCKAVFIDATTTPFGKDQYEIYRHDMALSMAQQGKEPTLSNQYAINAKETLNKWKNRIAAGEFVVYTQEKPDGERAASLDDLYQLLLEIDRREFTDCLEGEYGATANMYLANSLKLGVECGVNQKTSGTFRSAVDATKLEKALAGAWNVEEYWKTKPHLLISRIKRKVNEMIQAGFDGPEGRISIKRIYDELKAAPYGFMPCNLTAFVLGFVLKEYVNGQYNWYDGLTNEVLDVKHLKEMIDEVIKLDITPNARYKDKYIVATTPEEKAFNQLTSVAFGIPANLCTSVPDSRERIRGRMKSYGFPIWTLKSVLAKKGLKTPTEVLVELVDYYTGIANSGNLGTAKSESEIAISIGKLAMKYEFTAEDLKSLLNRETCEEGMAEYLKTFDDGALPRLAKEIDDHNQYLNVLRSKFDADAAHWVWNQETAQEKIREVILEYQIVAESNRVLGKNSSYESAIRDWMNRCGNIRISYAAASTYLDEMGPFLKLLCNLKKQGRLPDSQKAEFLNQLKIAGAAFVAFYSDPFPTFQKVCKLDLEGLSVEGQKEVYNSITGSDKLTMGKADYQDLVRALIQKYKESEKSARLKALWKEKTGTDSPSAWCRQNKMPLLCLIPEEEFATARDAFASVNSKNPGAASVEKAMEYLQRATFFAKLSDQAALDRAFVKGIVKGYADILADVNEVKNYLEKSISASPEDWLGLPQVDARVRYLAEEKYRKVAYKKAWEKVDRMNPEKAKEYLKDLIKNDPVVGSRILHDD